MPEHFIAETPDQLPTRATTLSISGLEFMERMLAGELPLAPIAKGMDYHLHSVKPDEVIFRGHCEREGFARIGFGECRGVVV